MGKVRKGKRSDDVTVTGRVGGIRGMALVESSASLGGQPSNTPPANNQIEEVCFGGASEDTFESSAEVVWPSLPDFEEFFRVMNDQVMEMRQQKIDSRLVRLTDQGTYTVYRIGAVVGLRYPVRIERDGVVILLRAVPDPAKNEPNCIIRLGSMACMASGGFDALCETVRAWLVDLGCYVRAWKPYRIDAAADFYGGDLLPYFLGAWHAGNWVSRSSHNKAYERPEALSDCYAQTFYRRGLFTGLEFGRGILCRIYDKELETRNDPVKRQWLIQNRWGGSVPSAATRIEFQMRSDHLKSFKIFSPEDWYVKRPSVLSYLTGKWLRFTENPPDGSHYDRLVDSAPWIMVQNAFASGFGLSGPSSRVYSTSVNLEQLRDQAMGCLSSAVGLIVPEMNPENCKAAFLSVAEKWFDELGSSELFARSLEKVGKLQMKSGQGLVLGGSEDHPELSVKPLRQWGLDLVGDRFNGEGI